MVLRIFPFFFIYLMTVIFTLINYIQSPGWPVETILRLMDGRYSNTVIYAIILFVVLRLKIRPGISIPVFIAAAILYFYTDKLLYRIFDPGAGVSFIKFFKFIIFYIILLYGYSKQRLKLVYTFATAILAAAATFAALISVYFIILFFSDPGGKIHSNTAESLLKLGFNSVFYSYEKSIAEQNSVHDVADLIRFSENAGREITFENAKWEQFIIRSGIKDAEKFFRYLYRKRIMLNYKVLSEYAVRQSSANPDLLSSSVYFKKYFALYYAENSDDFFSVYRTGDIVLRRWIIDVLGYVHNYDSIIFLVARLTDPDRKISEKAYEALKQLTKLDPAEKDKKEIHDLDVVDRFREYAEEIRKR